ncbi:MAG: molybdopterin oxidoreductase [Betaproteobacteria bacterium SG8_39]|nr:MAG: molybdopterin oxidoreductase [Betaproteobacteria bacterium SG8_39]
MPRELLSAYPVAEQRFDEMFGAPGAPRPHWSRVYDDLLRASGRLMRERVETVAREIRETGVTFDVHAGPQGVDRPWDLDVIPLILSPEEWAEIEAAVTQRAQLLDRILGDIYGAQHTLREGLLPPALVYGNASYLRPCVGLPVPGGVRLHNYAVDLARSPDGRWWVIADHAQSPLGVGYALENRLIISRVFPDLYRDLKVVHLATFFATLRDSLAHWAPSNGSAPFMVMLTAGPSSDGYFGQAYLSRYLGLPLVEVNDLTVREGTVWLKTVSGLRRVHVLLRRIADDGADPLELRGDSAFGIPGLVDAVRRGNVLVANALGASLLESASLFGFLPALAERLLGEPLRMPSLATWWCGEPAAREQAMARLEALIVKPAFPQLPFEPIFGQDLDAAGRAALAERIRARPNDFIAQERVELSQAPVWEAQARPSRLGARAMGLRVFVCASPNGYMAMPGGLARVATGPDTRVLSMQRGGSSKDAWVLSSAPVSTFSMLPPAIGADDLVRTGLDLSSRVVENLFWFGRQVERCDATARLLRVALARLTGRASASERGWPAMAGLLADRGLLNASDVARDDLLVMRALRAAVVDETRPGLARDMRDLSQIALRLRERMSTDNWRLLHAMRRKLVRRRAGPLALSEAIEELDHAIASLMTLAGFALDGMTRDLGWRFMSCGRRIERLESMCAILLQATAAGRDGEMEWALQLADSSVTYRSRYMAKPEWLPVLDLLIRDASNPRSIAFQLGGLNDYVQRIGRTVGEFHDERIAAAAAALAAIDPASDLDPESPRLRDLLLEWQAAAEHLSEMIGQRFFSHVAEERRQSVSA